MDASSIKAKNIIIGTANDALESAAKMVEIIGIENRGEPVEAERFSKTLAKKIRSMKHQLLT